MKKILLCSCIIFLLSKKSFSQIPNADFENWDYTGLGTLLEDWDSFYPDFGIPCLSPDTEAYSGNFAARFNNFGVASYAYTSFPISSKPYSLTAFLKANVATGDSISIRVVLYQASQPIDSGKWVGYFNLTTYTQVTVPISNTNASADSALIDIRGGSNTATGMLVDHLAFDLNSQVPNEPLSSTFTALVSPNPFHDELQIVIHSLADDFINLKLSDAEGKAIIEYKGLQILQGTNTITLNTSDLASGIYHCVLYDEKKHASMRLLKVN